MPDCLHLHISQIDSGAKSRRLTHIRSSDRPEIEIYHEFDRLIPRPEETVVDGHILAVLLYAATLGKRLVVHGAVSRSGLRNIDQLLAIWSVWRPTRYRHIEVAPERIVDIAKAGSGRAICAFSGGVDAATTVLRHTSVLAESLRHNLTTGMMVQGIDVKLSEDSVFADLVKRVSPFTESVGLELRQVRTNSRELEMQDWEDSHALELAACLHMCADEFDCALIGSSARYDQLEAPWGSHPMTDPLMSGDRLTIVHDGADLSRTEKVALVATNPIAVPALRVCYVGANKSTNCGRCPKCVKTQLSFVAAGFAGVPLCFDHAVRLEDVRRIELPNDFYCAGIASLIAYADEHHVKGRWLSILKRTVARYKRNGGKRSLIQRVLGRISRVWARKPA